MYNRASNEIGSEFWKEDKCCDVKYFLTGRTALEFIIRDILVENDIKSVLMPSYCCHTMLMPFMLHGIKVRFYDVYYEKKMRVELPEIKEKEIAFIIKYFGFSDLQGLENIRGKITIEDQTHSWLNGAESEADYTFVSYKKWLGVSGISRAFKRNGKFIDISLTENTAFDELREKAFIFKKQYMETGKGNKEKFLNLFNRAENLIETDYCGYRPSPNAFEQLIELDKKAIRESRRQNANFLISKLKQIPNIKLLFSTLEENDVPLFVPILSQDRDELRRYLIQKDIYLPVHWPLSKYHSGISERAKKLYDQELSVVCDQRYGIEEMERIVSAIRDFYSGRKTQ